MQTVFRANLSAANFPFVSDFWGRSVVVPQYDENYQTKQRFSGDDPDQDRGVPQVFYMHNCLPTAQGFKSIAYNRIVRPVAGLITPTFSKLIPAKDPSENKAFIGVTTDSRVFIYTAAGSTWTEVTAALGGWPGGNVYYAYANGYTYLCFSKFNIFKVDVINKTLTAVVLAGITNNLIVGVTSAANYLILHDGITVYWSSATNPEDFVPSLITGAGSGVPQDVNGQIVGCLPLGNGFAVYTTTNIIISSYSGNTNYPWIFRGASNSAGVVDTEGISYDGEAGTNYAWTSAGLLQVSAAGCTPLNPAATDFLAGRVFEDYDPATKALTTTYLNTAMLVKLTYVASRYLVISYGMTTLTHALIFDTAFKRWGKLKVTHVDASEIAVNAESATSWSALAGNTWSFYAGSAWTDFKSLGNIAANPGRTLGFLQADGTIQLAIWDYGNYSANAVLILGKYQITRNQLCTMQSVEVEAVDSGNTNFNVSILSTLDGKTMVSPATAPVLATTGAEVRKYYSRVSGVNHSIVFNGAFNIVAVILAMSRQGRR